MMRLTILIFLGLLYGYIYFDAYNVTITRVTMHCVISMIVILYWLRLQNVAYGLQPDVTGHCS